MYIYIYIHTHIDTHICNVYLYMYMLHDPLLQAGLHMAHFELGSFPIGLVSNWARF